LRDELVVLENYLNKLRSQADCLEAIAHKYIAFKHQIKRILTQKNLLKADCSVKGSQVLQILGEAQFLSKGEET
jgi:hypothetical protein